MDKFLRGKIKGIFSGKAANVAEFGGELDEFTGNEAIVKIPISPGVSGKGELMVHNKNLTFKVKPMGRDDNA